MLRLLLVLVVGLCATLAHADDAGRAALRQALAEGTHPARGTPLAVREREDLARFYTQAGFDPAWFAQGRPSAALGQAVEVLAGAREDGLDPRDYHVAWLAARAANAAPGAADARAAAVLDVAATLAMLAWLRDLHSGRIDPRAIHPNLALSAPPLDAVAALRDAIAGDAVRALPGRYAPQLALYRRLKDQLARYRGLASAPALPALPAVAKLGPGAAYAGAAALAARLAAFGDLAPGAKPVPADVYSRELAEAVRRFQSRHGLEPDGIVGKATFAALAVPPAERVTQIELGMERLRWLPAFAPQPLVVVNIPAFRLWAFDLPDDTRAPALAMRVIVGRALDTETPVFADTLRAIEFSPYWNVPRSIATKEILPRLRRDPGYLAREQMEFVRGDGSAVQAVTPENLVAVENGSLRIRQRPGKHNAMGRIKFVLPNHLAIFLHDTSAPQLFARTRRDFSHGCIRIEMPVALALFALDGERGWDAARVAEAMSRHEPAYAQLPRPVSVLIFYTTALADGEGRVFFYEDIYGHDRALASALAARQGR